MTTKNERIYVTKTDQYVAVESESHFDFLTAGAALRARWNPQEATLTVWRPDGEPIEMRGISNSITIRGQKET